MRKDSPSSTPPKSPTPLFPEPDTPEECPVLRKRSQTMGGSMCNAKNWLLRRRRQNDKFLKVTPNRASIGGGEGGSGGTSPVGSEGGGGSGYGSLMGLYAGERGGWAEERVTVVVVGRQGVGKTSLFNQLTRQFHQHNSSSSFDDSSPVVLTTIYHSKREVNFLEMNPEKNDLWSTFDCSGFIVVYSAIETSTLRHAQRLLTQIRTPTNSPHTPVWLVGTRGDFPANRKVSETESKKLADDFDARCFEVSCKGANRKDKTDSPTTLPLVANIANTFRSLPPRKLVERNMNRLQPLTAVPFGLGAGPALRKKSYSCENLYSLAALKASHHRKGP